MGITIKEIARRCGVSIGTVDRALNGRPGIKEETKRRILEVARQANYEPDTVARSLASGRSRTIGIVIGDLNNRSFAQLVNAAERTAREKGYLVQLMLTGKESEPEKQCLAHLKSRKADGIVLFPVNKGERFEAFLDRLGLPLVAVCNRLSERRSYVGIDDRSAMAEAADRAWTAGYRRFVYICPPLTYRESHNIHTQAERFDGFREALARRGAEEPIVVTSQDFVSELAKLEFGGAARTAVFCSCDAYALEALNHFRARGVRVPEDAGITGFDNIDMLKYVSPRLTTVHYDMEEIGRSAVELLVEQIETGQAPRQLMLPYRYVAGDSM